MESKDQQDHSENTSTTPSEVKKTPTKPRSRSHTSKLSVVGKFFIFLSFSLGCLAIGGGYYLYIEQQKKQENLAELSQQLTVLKNKLDTQSATDSDLSSQTDSLSNDVDKLQVAQSQLQSNISNIAQRSPKHWMAAEADYLVQMAGRKLWLEQDPTTAASLLKSADSQIAKMGDPSLLPLRKALAQDITQVKGIKRPDISGAVYEIDGVIAQLDRLPLNQARPTESTEEQSQELSSSVFDWHANLDKTWKALISDFVKVRKRQTDLAPLLSPEQSWYLVENIKNKLLQAQLALYRNDDVNFKQSMRLARKWVYEYFDLKDDATKAVISSIDNISKLSVQPVAIQKFHSLPLLKQLVTFGELNSPKENNQ
ncbi:uroporphyrinogen-III methylase [Shewanella sp. OPT22]|nr:uroporphyrinogen-III methylase [Shewanella sp. OPT22]